MAWPQESDLRTVDLSHIGDFVPVEVLYEFDGPCIFTALTAGRALVLAYLAEETDNPRGLRFVAATTSRVTVDELRRGQVSVREAILRGSLWVIDCDFSRRPFRAFAIEASELPEDALPAQGTMLWAALEAPFQVRLLGPEIQPGRIPAAALAQAGEIAANALKPVFEWAARALRRDCGGRPPEWLRRLYALPAQRIAYGSLEIGFGAIVIPEPAQASLPLDGGEMATPQEILANGWSALLEGLCWAASNDELDDRVDEDEKWLAILEALRRLAPGSTGPVVSVEVSGRVVDRSGQPFELGRDTSKRIRAVLARLKQRNEVQLEVFQGRIRDLDLDRLTFILRNPVSELEVTLILEDEQFMEVAREAHYQELPVRVAARSTDGKTWTAVEVEFLPS